MRKRAVDLSLEELAVMGASAALQAAQTAQDAGLVVSGTVDFLEDGRVLSALAERRRSGAVTVLGIEAADVATSSGTRGNDTPNAKRSAD